MKLLFKLTLILFIFLHLQSVPIYAAVAQDNDAGTYQNDFNTNAGLVTQSGAGINTATGVVQLRNSSNGYTAPYNSSGYIITQTISPLWLASLDNLVLDATIPENTSIKVQVLDNENYLFQDFYFTGNSEGIASTQVDLSSLPILARADQRSYSKTGSFRFKITLSTSDTSVTPTINSLNLSWIKVQGNPQVSSPLAPDENNWPSQYGSSNIDYHSPVKITVPYFTFKDLPDINLPTALSTGDNLIYNGNRIIQNWGYYSNLISYNTVNSQIGWSLPMNNWAGGMITTNGTYYNTEILNDNFIAVDLNSGNILWTYNFGGGHGNGIVTSSLDGSHLFTTRDGADTNYTDIYAFNPSGSVAWVKRFNSIGTYIVTRNLLVAGDDSLIFNYSVIDISSRLYTEEGGIYSFKQSDGSENWHIDTGKVDAMTNTGDKIIYGRIYNNQLTVKALSYDGEVLWTNTQEPSFARTSSYITNFTVRPNGSVVANISGNFDGNIANFYLYAYDINNGQLLWNRYGDPADSVISDGNNNLILSAYDNAYSEDNPISYAQVSLRDSEGYRKCMLNYGFTSIDDNYLYDFGFSHDVSIGAGGVIYVDLYRQTMDRNWAFVDGGQPLAPIALIPWTASLSVSPSALKPGSDVTLTAQTSMLQQNPLFDTDNYIQVVLSNGSKIPLTYSHTQGDNTIWTATTKIPENFSSGSHTFTLEANAAHIQTDIPLHFDSPAPDSLNTGITAVASIIIDSKPPESQWQDPSGNRYEFNSLGDDFVTTSNPLPAFEFIQAGSGASSITKYQLILNNEVYLDNIFAGSQTYADDFKRLEFPDNHTIKIIPLHSTLKLKPGVYSWKVKALNQVGESLETQAKTLTISNLPFKPSSPPSPSSYSPPTTKLMTKLAAIILPTNTPPQPSTTPPSPSQKNSSPQPLPNSPSKSPTPLTLIQTIINFIKSLF